MTDGRTHVGGDPWGNPYNYRTSGTGFTIYSSGPASIDDRGKGDDVTSETPWHRPREYTAIDLLMWVALASALVGMARGSIWSARRLFN